eukprot:scaffold183_cov249-Pinguiococcus_pyrenoidosus.AAC.10
MYMCDSHILHPAQTIERVYLNVSQEGKSDVEFLREEELLYGLQVTRAPRSVVIHPEQDPELPSYLPFARQVSSRSYKPVTCYQISEKGKELVKRVSRKDREAVHDFVYAPGTHELLRCAPRCFYAFNSKTQAQSSSYQRAEWRGHDYWLSSAGGYARKSTMTDTEDVSYVSSAYVPQCLRYGGRPTLSNAHRAHESAVSTVSGTVATPLCMLLRPVDGGKFSQHNIRDELDEVITLNSVSIIVAEYIPFGANQVVQLNNNVGTKALARDRDSVAG